MYLKVLKKSLKYKNKNNLCSSISIAEIRATVLVTLDRGLNEEFGIVSDKNVISEVIPGYPISRSGELNVGDEILAIAKTPVNETDDIRSLLKNSGQTVYLSISRMGRGKRD